MCVKRSKLTLMLFSKSLFTCARSKVGMVFSVIFISLGSVCSFACCLSGLPLDSQVSKKLVLQGSSLLCFSATAPGDGSSPEMSSSEAVMLFSGLVTQSPRVPTGMLGSTIHGSVPCSNWEITSGLETWSPIHWNFKKKSYLSAVREKCLLRVHSHRFVYRDQMCIILQCHIPE